MSSFLNLYQIDRTDIVCPGQYASMIVAADSEEEAIRIPFLYPYKPVFKKPVDHHVWTSNKNILNVYVVGSINSSVGKQVISARIY